MIKVRKTERTGGLYFPSSKIWAIDIFGQMIDLRIWYKIMTPKEKKRGMKWKEVDIWYLDYEIKEIESWVRDDGKKNYKKPFIRKKISLFESSHFQLILCYRLRYVWTFLLGYATNLLRQLLFPS